jgi:IS30 family transposase
LSGLSNHPYSLRERKLNEFTKRHIRQYVSKKQNFNDINYNDIKSFQIKNNKRPGKLLNFDASIDRFFKMPTLVT